MQRKLVAEEIELRMHVSTVPYHDNNLFETEMRQV
jgi:hypothetical protein